jgi:hypothetical protein
MSRRHAIILKKLSCKSFANGRFSSMFVRWVMSIVNDGKVIVLVNQIGPYFTTDRGLRQGDPISLILVHVLSIIIHRAIDSG